MKIAILGDLSVTESNEKNFAKQDIKTLFNDVPSVWKGYDNVIVNSFDPETELYTTYFFSGTKTD